ncbi:MAG: uroporphyrinogen decarboxylase family protein [Spirochaetia bacterium]
MTPKDRLLATLSGKPHDRVPVYTQIPFGLEGTSFVPAPFHGYSDYDSWRKKDPAYQKLVKRMEKECDNFFIWRPPCMGNDQFFLSPAYTTTEEKPDGKGRIVRISSFSQGGLELTERNAVQPGTGHSWEIEHFCKSPEDAAALLELPWEGYPAEAGDFRELETALGDRGVMWVTIPSPIQTVCRLFDPNDFLIFARTEEKLIMNLMEAAAERIRRNLETLLEQGVGPVIRFGGAEHATPPLMSPDDFDRLVVRFDQPLVDLCKRRGRFVAYHCHGNITHALKRFTEMGVDQTDPVETAPDGDLTLKEARDVSRGLITLTGNIQSREIAAAEPEQIRSRVEGIIRTAGPERLVISTTGTPLEKMDSRTEENYHVMIDTALEFGTEI